MGLQRAVTAPTAAAATPDIATIGLSVSLSGITATSVTISWSLDQPATGQVEYGTTTAYGLVSVPQHPGAYLAHVEQFGALSPGTVYHFRVTALDVAGALTMSPDDTFTTLGGSAAPNPGPVLPPGPGPGPDPSASPDPTAPPTPDPTGTPDPEVSPTPGPTPPTDPIAPAASGTSLYGAPFNLDTKANLQVGWTDRARVAHRFVASATSGLLSVRFQQRGGPIYSGGTNGRLRVTVQTDASGVPSGIVLAEDFYTPPSSSDAWTNYDLVRFGSPASVVQGSRYYIVFEDVDPDPVNNYFSINELYVYGARLTPRQPAFADEDYAVLYATPDTWTVQDNYTADMDITYANGTHDGMAYIQNMTTYFGTISGSASVREQFTVSGGSRTVSKAYVRVRRSSGSSPLTIRLETGSGSLIESVDVPASSVPISAAGGDNGGSVWVAVTFATAHTLANGSSYNLCLTTPSGTAYTAAPIREGTDAGLDSLAFRDGSGQASSNGTTWADLYAHSPVDLQFYFR